MYLGDWHGVDAPSTLSFTRAQPKHRTGPPAADLEYAPGIASYHLKFTAQTGKQHPNMSTTFMGRSRPLEDMCRQTPKSADPAKTIKTLGHILPGLCNDP